MLYHPEILVQQCDEGAKKKLGSLARESERCDEQDEPENLNFEVHDEIFSAESDTCDNNTQQKRRQKHQRATQQARTFYRGSPATTAVVIDMHTW